MEKKNRISSRDVAKEAGVSQATVSYVLNDVQGIKIKPETRQAVLVAAKKLNYHPSQMARGMKLRRSMAVGVITDRSVTNYNFMKTLEGIKDALKQHNYAITLLFNLPGDKPDNEIIEYYNSHRLDGIIFAFATVEDATIDELNAKGVPYVIIDAHPTGRDAHEVGTDHLIHIPALIHAFKQKGASGVAYTGPLWHNKTDRRTEAYQLAAAESGLMDYGCHLCVFNDEEITQTVMALLKDKNRPDCILAGSPRFGFFVLKCAASLGISVPGSLMTAALGTSLFYDLCYPSLTAVELPLYDMGQSGAKVLVDLMKGQEIEKTVILPSEIHFRESI